MITYGLIKQRFLSEELLRVPHNGKPLILSSLFGIENFAKWADYSNLREKIFKELNK